MKKFVTIKAINLQNKLLDEVKTTDIEMTIWEIPHPVKSLKIVPVKWAILSNFVSSTILAVRKWFESNPELFSNIADPENVARLFRDNLINVMADLSKTGNHVFKVYADSKKWIKMDKKVMTDDDILSQLWWDDEGDDEEEVVVVKKKKETEVVIEQEEDDTSVDDVITKTTNNTWKEIAINEYKITKPWKVKARWINRKWRDYIWAFNSWWSSNRVVKGKR